MWAGVECLRSLVSSRLSSDVEAPSEVQPPHSLYFKSSDLVALWFWAKKHVKPGQDPPKRDS